MTENKNISEIIERDGVYVGTIRGVSMRPMLRDGRDTVVIASASGRLKKYDVALFRHNGRYILHRVVKVLPDSYITCGDNSVNKERVNDSEIVGVLCEFYRGERHCRPDSPFNALYSRMSVFFMPLRIFSRRTALSVARAFKRKR